MEKELTPKQQTSEALRQADSILVVTGQHPSVDQVSATIALTAILRKFGKKVTAVISDEIPTGARFLPTKFVDTELGGLRDFILQVGLQKAEVDKLKYTIENGSLNIHVTPFAGGFKPADVSFAYGDYQFDLVVVLGVASYTRIDRVFGQNADQLREAPLINIDFHRSNEQYGAINLVESSAASLAEILVALSESLQSGMIDAEIAQILLTGIVASTDRFTATHTTAKSLTVAAQMMAAGADHQQVIRGLYRDRNTSADRPKRTDSAPRVAQITMPTTGPQTTPVAARPAPSVSQSATAAAPVVPAVPVAPITEPAPLQRKPLEEITTADMPLVATPLSDDDASIVATPTAAPIAAMPLPTLATPTLDSDSPAVTDPEEQPAVPVAAAVVEPELVAPLAGESLLDDLGAEPLINSQDDPQPAVAPAPAKAANPTNKPVFANRLSR
jgi:hypothetical protein